MHDVSHPSVERAAPRERIVCLHCSGSSGRQWDAYVHALSPQFEVVAPNLLGYGSSQPWPPRARPSLDDEAAHVARWIEGAAGGVHLIGHSYGGAVALQLALRWPQHVRSLTLYEPVRFALLFARAETAAAADDIVRVGRHIGELTRCGRLLDAAQVFADYWSGAGAWQRLDSRRQQTLMQRMPKVVTEFEALFADPVPPRHYRAVAMPVLLLSGTRSPQPARLVADILAAELPQVEPHRLEHRGHMAPVVHAAELIAQLRVWLRQSSVEAELPLAA